MNAHFLNSDILGIGMPQDFVALVSSVSDVAIVTDRSGVVLDIIWNLETDQAFDPQTLIGLQIAELVTTECRAKIAEMLTAEGPEQGGRQREINHKIAGLDEFPVRYNAVGAGDSVIFLGHEIRAVAALQSRLVEAQRALDQDYSRLRQLETQYRVLFQTSSEALIVVDAATGQVEDVNAAATQILGQGAADVEGHSFEALFAEDEAATVKSAMSSVGTLGQSEQFRATLRQRQQDVFCSISIFRAAQATLLLCTVTQTDQGTAGAGGIEDLLIGLVSRIPDAMVLTDEDGRIRWCNDAFLGMTETALAHQIEGEPLSRFMGRPGVDMDIIIANAREHGRLRAFSSVLTGEYGSETKVEISVASLSEPKPMIGFVMRDISRYDQIPARKPEVGKEASSDLINLVGTVPLKDLVRASTEEIEKMCIEAALKKTGNNRASAADMLGLSRQSLYVKLRRFGLLEREV